MLEIIENPNEAPRSPNAKRMRKVLARFDLERRFKLKNYEAVENLHL
jgi:hypothetical protein